jgi:hypothetical protein
MINEANEDSSFENVYTPMAQSPLFVSNIYYKKDTGKKDGKILRMLGNTNESTVKFIPDRLRTQGLQSESKRFDFPLFGFKFKSHTDYYISNNIDVKKLKIENFAHVNGKLIERTKKTKGNKLKMETNLLVYRNIDICED